MLEKKKRVWGRMLQEFNLTRNEGSKMTREQMTRAVSRILKKEQGKSYAKGGSGIPQKNVVRPKAIHNPYLQKGLNSAEKVRLELIKLKTEINLNLIKAHQMLNGGDATGVQPKLFRIEMDEAEVDHGGHDEAGVATVVYHDGNQGHVEDQQESKGEQEFMHL